MCYNVCDTTETTTLKWTSPLVVQGPHCIEKLKAKPSDTVFEYVCLVYDPYNS